MTIKKNTLVKVGHTRHGVFNAKAFKNFNTDDEWYPLVLTDSLSEGMSTIWIKDDLHRRS